MATRFSEALPRGLRFEPSRRRVRAEVSGVTVADSTGTLLVWEPERVVPVYCFPQQDVRMDLLRPGNDLAAKEHSASVSVFTVEAGERTAENAAWTYADADLAGFIALDYKPMDAWYEEEERVLAHPRDPFKRVDVRQSSRHVRVEVEGHVLADSHRPRLLFETGLPTRYYLPREDVRMDLLRPSDTRTLCAYKGEASHWSATVDGRVYGDVAWSYPEPLPDNPKIRDLICFLNERVDIYVDGELLPRPTTQWSSDRSSSPRE